MLRILSKYATLAAMLLLLLALLLVTKLIWERQPNSADNPQLKGIGSKVEIAFSEFGVPNIDAASDRDALVALGWLHARDRLFQMDVLRRIGKGELSALFGESTLKTDRLFRTLGTRAWSQQQAQDLPERSPQLQSWLGSYVEGINQYLDAHPVPLEYLLLNASPEPFSTTDVFATLSYMAHSFTAAFKQDPLLTDLYQHLDPAYHHVLQGHWQHAPDSLPELGDLTAYHQVINALPEHLPLGQMQGSNGWLVSAARSASGAPLFANDPHISFSTPQVWYEAQLHTPNRSLYGHYLPGLPIPLLGQTPSRVWGLTMLLNDDADLFQLQSHQQQYLLDGEPHSYALERQSIPVKGQADEILTIYHSRFGPRIDQILELSEPTALYWTFTESENQPLQGLMGLVNANSMTELSQHLPLIWSPGVNLLYADTDGNIAKWAVARYLKRAPGISGATVIDGSQRANRPRGFYAFDENPREINPESGLIFSANHPYRLPLSEQEQSSYYAPLFRPQWLAQQLQSQATWTAADFKSLQTDSRNLRFELLKAPFLAATAELPSEQRQQLAQWDGRYRPNSAAPTLFEAFYYQLLKSIFADELGMPLFDRLRREGLIDKMLYQVVNAPTSLWWNNVDRLTYQNADDTLKTAWQITLQQLEGSIAWQDNARYRHRHAMGSNDWLQALFEGPKLAISGSKRALNNVSYRYQNGNWQGTFGPSTRRIVDLAKPSQVQVISPLGQSGVQFTPHFADQAELYQQGLYRQIQLTPASTVDLTLQPHP
ncbi:penicillin acylase family protein [Ferrimonas pelagia]|uniref:N-acylhomoserine lactone acylase HacB n=1 Tax=Ferrimonas pelagia TaxID=1177826 RepID=A0ABP9EK03_9GAMM